MFNLRDLFLINIRSVIDTLNKTDVLSVMLKATNVFAEGANIGDIGSKLKMVAKLMRLNEQYCIDILSLTKRNPLDI